MKEKCFFSLNKILFKHFGTFENNFERLKKSCKASKYLQLMPFRSYIVFTASMGPSGMWAYDFSGPIPKSGTSNSNCYWIGSFEKFSIFQSFYSTPVLSDFSSRIRIHNRYDQLLVVVVVAVVFVVVGPVVVVFVLVEEDAVDPGVADVEIFPTLKNNTNNRVMALSGVQIITRE